MRDLGAHGITVTLPPGWEGRVFRRPSAGEVSATEADGPSAPPGETTHAVVHVATIPLPVDLGDFGSAAVPDLGPDDAFVMLVEFDPASVSQPLFARAGVPRSLENTDFSPQVMQRRIEGQAGAQIFCNEAGRAFCLYVVIGSYRNRSRIVPRVNAVLAALDVSGSGARAAESPTTTSSVPAGMAPDTTIAPTTTTPPSTTAAPTTAPPTTAPPTTTGPTP
jgi:hypothetical protein